MSKRRSVCCICDMSSFGEYVFLKFFFFTALSEGKGAMYWANNCQRQTGPTNTVDVCIQHWPTNASDVRIDPKNVNDRLALQTPVTYRSIKQWLCTCQWQNYPTKMDPTNASNKLILRRWGLQMPVTNWTYEDWAYRCQCHIDLQATMEDRPYKDK